MWEIIGIMAGVVVAITATITLIWTLMEKGKQKRIAEYDEKKLKQEKERDLREELRMATFRGGLTEEIATILNLKLSGYETKEEARESDTKIWDKLEAIDAELVKHFKESNKNEMSRLANEIVNFADTLRAGSIRSQGSYQHISGCYDSYKKLGGNHYVDEQYKYITIKLEEVNQGES